MDYKILIVDDEGANLRMLERLFRGQYKVVSAESGAEALELLAVHDIALILSDQRMPGMTGIEFLKRAAEMRPHTVRVILTGYTDVNALVEAINSGVVYKYVTKPWVNEDLQQTVKRALQHYETIKNQHELRLHNERLQTRLKTTVENFVKIISAMLDLKEPQGHCGRTADYASAIGRHLNLEPEKLEQLAIAGRLHEFVHISIPNNILHKTTAFNDGELLENQLTEGERLILTHNFERGLEMIESVPDLEDAVFALRYQHEHFDGSGYPAGLGGEQIPILARILAVADAYDKMTASYSFQQNLTNDAAIEQLRSNAGKKFDPEIIKAFCELKSDN